MRFYFKFKIQDYYLIREIKRWLNIKILKLRLYCLHVLFQYHLNDAWIWGALSMLTVCTLLVFLFDFSTSWPVPEFGEHCQCWLFAPCLSFCLISVPADQCLNLGSIVNVDCLHPACLSVWLQYQLTVALHTRVRFYRHLYALLLVFSKDKVRRMLWSSFTAGVWVWWSQTSVQTTLSCQSRQGGRFFFLFLQFFWVHALADSSVLVSPFVHSIYYDQCSSERPHVHLSIIRGLICVVWKHKKQCDGQCHDFVYSWSRKKIGRYWTVWQVNLHNGHWLSMSAMKILIFQGICTREQGLSCCQAL